MVWEVNTIRFTCCHGTKVLEGNFIANPCARKHWSNPAIMLMPITGLSTLSILLAAQLIDLEADSPTGKHGIAHRFGTKATAWLYQLVQFTVVGLVLLYYFRFPGTTWPFLLCLIPYVFILPKAGSIPY